MVGYHFFRLDKNGQIYGHGRNLNTADIEFVFFSAGCFGLQFY